MSKVDFNEFSEKFAEVLEIKDDKYLSAQLSDVSEYDSVGKINVSLLIEDLFHFQIDHDVLNEKDTLQSLYDFCCKQ